MMTTDELLDQLRIAKDSGKCIVIIGDHDIADLLADLSTRLGVDTLTDRTTDHPALQPHAKRQKYHGRALARGSRDVPTLQNGEVWARFRRGHTRASDFDAIPDPWFLLKPGDFAEKDRQELEIGTPCSLDSFMIGEDIYIAS